MSDRQSSWRNTTHDWAHEVDLVHLEQIRHDAARFAPGGVLHLVLEVLAYPVDEAAVTTGAGARTVQVRLYADGSVSVTDDGRGTDTRVDASGQVVRKPVMATKDLRFFDSPDAETLPDAHPRRGMSVVAALSEWLVHTNRRHDGAWTQRYEHGVPVGDLTPVDVDGSTGTTVWFGPDPTLVGGANLDAHELHVLATAFGTDLHITVSGPEGASARPDLR